MLVLNLQKQAWRQPRNPDQDGRNAHLEAEARSTTQRRNLCFCTTYGDSLVTSGPLLAQQGRLPVPSADTDRCAAPLPPAGFTDLYLGAMDAIWTMTPDAPIFVVEGAGQGAYAGLNWVSRAFHSRPG